MVQFLPDPHPSNPARPSAPRSTPHPPLPVPPLPATDFSAPRPRSTLQSHAPSLPPQPESRSHKVANVSHGRRFSN
ncbi:hypothetical protein E2C01_095336 [Portunus trituberculatus]|uniref:Uncharacterized protein n=1 Tax=Portunus trituberculatus TaxID=210409 RepID=A0A5B7JPJ5_PORTR|nr:hypothetical protein [Portunus trituberculatus]